MKSATSDTHWNTSAEVYGIESLKIGFYQITNRELIEAGQLQADMTVVDLACGTGLTCKTILDSVKGEIVIYAVDMAQEMLKQAKRSIKSNAVRFIHASADDFAHYIPNKVDHVFCNAAFWHFLDAGAALREIHAVMRPTGRFLFNIPDQEFDFGDGRRSEVAQVVKTCIRRSTTQGVSTCPEFSFEKIHTLASANGFGIVDFKTLTIPIYREDLIKFYSIPHVSTRRFPKLSPQERITAVKMAFSTLEPNQAIPYRWAQFTLAPCQVVCG